MTVAEWKTAEDRLRTRVAELEAEVARLNRLLAREHEDSMAHEDDANLLVFLLALANEHGYMPDPGESAYDFLQRAIMTGSPAAIHARSKP